MLNHKLEKAIFIVIFIVVAVVIGYYATQMKAYILPINSELTPEKVIKLEYPEIERKHLDYHYFIKDDFLFLCFESETGYSDFDIAFRNEESGFMFDVPGSTVGLIYKSQNKYTVLKNGPIINAYIRKYNNKYAVIILEPLDNSRVDVYINNKEMQELSFEGASNAVWG